MFVFLWGFGVEVFENGFDFEANLKVGSLLSIAVDISDVPFSIVFFNRDFSIT